MRDTIIKARDIETKVSYLIHGEWIYIEQVHMLNILCILQYADGMRKREN